MAETYKASNTNNTQPSNATPNDQTPPNNPVNNANGVIDTLGKEVGSKYLQAHGVPAPLANMVSEKVMDSKLGKMAKKRIANNPIANRVLNKAKPAVDAAKPLLDAKNKGNGTPGGSPISPNGLQKFPFNNRRMSKFQMRNNKDKEKESKEKPEEKDDNRLSTLKQKQLMQKKKSEETGFQKFIKLIKKHPWILKFILVGGLILAFMALLFVVIAAATGQDDIGNGYNGNSTLTLNDAYGNPLGVVTLEELTMMNVAQLSGNVDAPISYYEVLVIAERTKIFSNYNSGSTITWNGSVDYTDLNNLNANIITAGSNTSGKTLVQNGETYVAVDYISEVVNESNKNFGINLSQALELANSGSTSEEIISVFYTEDVKIDIIVRAGLQLEDGIYVRVNKPEYYGNGDARNNPYFYSSLNVNYPGLMGECTWYAYGRANEILDNLEINKDWSYMGNGGTFCDSAQRGEFESSSDYSKPLPGSILSWKNGSYGHVAIIENVYHDSNGNVTGVSMTDGGMGLGYYSRAAGRYWFDTVTDRSNFSTRDFNCNTYAGANSSGCFRYSEFIAINSIQNYSGTFQCYIYLSQPK